MLKRLALAASVFVASLLPAAAQNVFNTATSGKTVVGTVMMCLNSSGVAVPVTTSSSQCFGSGLAGTVNLTEILGVAISGGVSGSLPVTIVGGGGSGGTASSYGAAFPATGTATGLSDGTNMVAFRGDTTNGAWVNVKTSALPTGAATATLQSTGNTSLASIITALGTPFQAGGSIGNTTFASTQSGTWTVQPGNTANTTAWLVTGTGGTFPATQSGTWNVTNISGTVSLPTGASTAANQATANGSLATIVTNTGVHSVYGPTANASPAANPPVVIGGTANGGATGNVGNWKVDSSGSGFIDMVAGGNLATALAASAVAPGATWPSNVNALGAKAINAEQTAVTNGQAQSMISDLAGRLITLPYSNPEFALAGLITTAMTSTTDTALTGMGAQGSGVRNYVTGCTISNSHATQGTEVVLKDGSAGAVLWTFPAAPAFGGAVMPFPVPIKTTANTGLFAANLTSGAAVKVSCAGFKGR